ncbi:HlyD family type I secretion periplasmic adaptor subunit [Sphingomonas quercus]|uniref:Membrane fusion protein (MFP) family protein n=1 Tax=Sphingomonas quercus TaxID=2842451 RepID=A0ABS6BIZ6_9SPHN|nr:HlyD family type I secretion periplasmic adaptor subunit [Sphingomonas quercus]MBU3077199.1 HlyD family type I secretion periplasmic adaptor subunit [Sphingomonas quercus]
MNALVEHVNIARSALRHEREMARKAIRVEETAFLPAALELIERPVSPMIRLTARVLLAGLVFLVAWMALGRIDIVATARGKVIPSDNVKLVQPAFQGVVRRILVHEGQTVAKGQPLVMLDATESTADAAQARKAMEEAELDAARARAILSGLDGHGVVFRAPAGVEAAVAATQAQLARAQYAQITADAAMQASDARAAAAAVSEARQQAEKLDETLPLLDEQIAANETLLTKGYVSKLKVIEMRRQRMASARDRDIAMKTAVRAQAQLAAAGSGVAKSRAAARAAILADLVKAEADAKLRKEELVKADNRSGLQTLVAPVAGVVTALQLHTEGGVAEATRPIMSIVPSAGGVIVEAQVLSRDIGFVRAGQAVSVKLDAFPFTRHGTVPGHVESVSADAQDVEKLGPVYTARIRLDRATIDRGDRVVPLIPGMAAAVDIKTGKRTILDYLLSPIDAARMEAGRER